MSALDNGTRPAFVAPTAEKAAKVVVLVVVLVSSNQGRMARFVPDAAVSPMGVGAVVAKFTVVVLPVPKAPPIPGPLITAVPAPPRTTVFPVLESRI